VVIREIGNFLHRKAPTVNGKSLWANNKDAVNYNPAVITPLEKPFKPQGGIAVLKGNLAPDGAVLKVENRTASDSYNVFTVDPSKGPQTVVSGPEVTGHGWSSARLAPYQGRTPVVLTGTARDEGGLASVSFTVVDCYGWVEPVVEPVEGFLAHLHAVERSPNTVKAYAHDLRDWFEFLDQRGVVWSRVRLCTKSVLSPLRVSVIVRKVPVPSVDAGIVRSGSSSTWYRYSTTSPNRWV